MPMPDSSVTCEPDRRRRRPLRGAASDGGTMGSSAASWAAGTSGAPGLGIDLRGRSEGRPASSRSAAERSRQPSPGLGTRWSEVRLTIGSRRRTRATANLEPSRGPATSCRVRCRGPKVWQSSGVDSDASGVDQSPAGVPGIPAARRAERPPRPPPAAAADVAGRTGEQGAPCGPVRA